MKTVTLILCLALAPFAKGQETNDLVQQLATISDFAFGGTGVAGVPSKGELLFEQILKSSSAEKDFLHILDTGNAQAKCYALAGLRAVNPDLGNAKAQIFISDTTTVHSISGCMMYTEPMNAAVSNILSGEFDFSITPKP